MVVLSRRPTDTDPSTHPTVDEVSEGVRVVAAAQDPHEFTFGDDMMAWTMAMGHAMTRAGLSIRDWRPDVVHAHDWLVAHPRSRWPNSSMCHWFPPSTPPRPADTPAGSRRGQPAAHALSESWLVHESDSLITCSASDARGDHRTVRVRDRPETTTVIPNGSTPTVGCSPCAALHAEPTEPTEPAELLYFGRLGTRRACTTRSPRCPDPAQPIPAPP